MPKQNSTAQVIRLAVSNESKAKRAIYQAIDAGFTFEAVREAAQRIKAASNPDQVQQEVRLLLALASAGIEHCDEISEILT